MYLNQVTPEMIIQKYCPDGGTHDGIQVFNNKKRSLGYITDLKKKFLKEYKPPKAEKPKKEKVDRDVLAKELYINLREAFLSNNDIKVIMNVSMPNIDVKHVRLYCIVGNVADSNMVSFRFAGKTDDEVFEILSNFNVKKINAAEQQYNISALTAGQLIQIANIINENL